MRPCLEVWKPYRITPRVKKEVGDWVALHLIKRSMRTMLQKLFVNYVHICENLRLLLVSLNRRPRINFVRHSNFVHPPFPCVASSSLAALKFKKKRYRERSIWFLCLLWLLRFWLYMIGFMKISKEIERACISLWQVTIILSTFSCLHASLIFSQKNISSKFSSKGEDW